MTTPWGMINARRDAEECRRKLKRLQERIDKTLQALKHGATDGSFEEAIVEAIAILEEEKDE